MTSLARGLAVMRCIAIAERPVTIADAARYTSLSRAAVRRCIYTLSLLGYVAQEGRGYIVRRQALSLGHPYLSINSLASRAQPALDALRDVLGESCSLGVMEDDQLCYIARAEATRVMSVSLRVGSCLPLYCTSMGRVLLAGRPNEEQEAYLARTSLQVLTKHTITAPQRLLVVIRSAGSDGFSFVDQELEIGLRSIAVPVRRRGQVVAALNVGTSAARMSAEEMRKVLLPPLLETAARLDS
ncbi:IclR family transcriptional regulator domain-containing protein [Novosphingobium colocasiae]|nr:IclR family transcriptional regulator C-terminal domain-containing protein [Novosphingobium colocasiae]